MAAFETPPFERGFTYFDASQTPDATSGIQFEGREFEFNDLDLSVTGTKSNRTGQKVVVRVVRNMSGINLLPKRLANLAKTAGKLGGRVDGYAFVAGQRCFPIDEWLPSAGVRDKDLFFIVVRGPAVVLTDLATLGGNIDVGDTVCAQTAATSQATTAGRVIEQDLTGATALLAVQVQNRIGEAMSALTTANTNADLLVSVIENI